MADTGDVDCEDWTMVSISLNDLSSQPFLCLYAAHERLLLRLEAIYVGSQVSNAGTHPADANANVLSLPRQ